MKREKETVVIIAAGGSGRRFGGPKQMEKLRGRPLLYWSLDAFQKHPEVKGMVLVLKQDLIPVFCGGVFSKLEAVVPGGTTRQESVSAGLSAAGRPELILVHDGARPFVEAGLISRVIAGALKAGAALPGIPVEDTLKKIGENGHVKTEDRPRYIRAQTPQGFRFDVLKAALEEAGRCGYTGTDDAALVERLDHDVLVVPGDRKNIKITTPWDLRLAEVLFDLPNWNRI
ncbi:MAG: 2-C-methyl-D-erythritol 4-phosphate cytidylyltransferase [Candidatus Aminicenantes bacterium]